MLSALAGVCADPASCRTVNGAGKQPQPRSLVAPLFIHGEGRGSLGCIVVNPPVFLSEAGEARQIVQEEAAKAGIAFRPPPEKPEILPPIDWDAYPRGEYRDKRRVPTALQFDGRDEKRSLQYEYVSRQDLDKWEGPSEGTALHYDVKGSAQTLDTSLAKQKQPGISAIFYDPVEQLYPAAKGERPSWAGDEKQLTAAAVARAKADLRAQVKDFIAWLKAQMVI